MTKNQILGPILIHLTPKILREFYLYQLDIVTCYHCMQFQISK